MLLTRRSVTMGSAAVVTTALTLGPQAFAAPRRKLHARSAEDGQAVLDWQLVAFRTVYAEQVPVTPTPVGVPTLAFTSLAMHQAAQRSAHLGTGSESAAVAQAAHDVLVHYYPASTGNLDASLATTFAAIGPGHSLTKGARIGADAAQEMLVSRQGDGWLDPGIHYSKAPGVGFWQPTAPNTDMVAPWLGSVRPVVVTAGTPGGPYALSSAAWAADYEEVRALGGAVSTERSPEQTATALFYNNLNAGAAMGDAVARYLAAHPVGILDAAHLFASMHGAAADTIIRCWQQKRDVGFWRPFQAISGQYDDGNAGTTAEPGWGPLVPKPNYPEYFSGHGSLTSPQVAAVRNTLGEHTALEIRSPGVPARAYSQLSEIEYDAFNARIWGGLHYRKAMTDAYELGHSTAARVLSALG